MLKSNQITIVIVAYHNDFALLDRCLKSFEDHCDLDQIHSIKVILNDFPIYNQSLQELLNKYPALKLDMIPAFDLEPAITNFFNWTTQQLFKLIVCDRIETNWYIIHDCKDYYTEKVDLLTDCFTEDGRAVTKLDYTLYNTNKQGSGLIPFTLANEISCKVWGVDPSDSNWWHLPTTTPFFVKTEMMCAMVNELRSILKGFFPYLFSLEINEQRFVTEFLLYSAYCTRQNNLADYADRSEKPNYYNKLQQSKDLRITFPPNPKENQKICIEGTIWVYTNQIWTIATK